MSRIGRMPIEVPAGVTVEIAANNFVKVKGPLGSLERSLHPDMELSQEANVITVKRPSETKLHKSLHGLTRTLLSNMVVGVATGFKRELDINGVGYRAAKNGNVLALSLGYSHPVELTEPEGITIEVPAQNKIIVKGTDKQLVGQIAAIIREKRPPEPYKGKGIKYTEERIRRKEGKAGKAKK